jgi:hypothetical protein
MSDSDGTKEHVSAGAAAAAMLRHLSECIDELLGLDAERLTRDEVLDCIRGIEQQRRRLSVADLPLLAQLDTRNIAAELRYRGSQQLLSTLLTSTSRQASHRLDDAERFGPRVALTGAALPPAYPVAAAALSAGDISTEHARIIANAIRRLPDRIRQERSSEIERSLTEHARTCDTRTLQALAYRITAHLHPDGDLPGDADDQHRRQRQFSLHRNRNETGELLATLTPACQAIWEAVLTPLAQPRPADAMGPDTRTIGQRWHDAFEQAGQLLLDTGQIPDHAGLHTTMVITVSLTDLEQRIGAATTHHGGTLTIAEALRLAAGQQVIPAVLDDAGGVLAYGRRRRLASPGQRLALFARDRGCTFPNCTRPAAQTQVHHATDWVRAGRTDLDNLTLTCGYHNNEAPRQGWTTQMIDKVAYWIPPAWKDPTRTPQRNYQHHPEQALPAGTTTPES